MFTPEQRLQLSKKIISLPEEIVKADELIADTIVAKDKLEDLDNAHKLLIDQINPIINAYQGELSWIDGNGRLELNETIQINSAKKILGNFFFPNNTQINMPSIDNNVWVFFPPFSRNIAVGRQYNESYAQINGEFNLYSEILSIIATIEGFTGVQRVTGQICAMDTVTPFTAVVDALDELKTRINLYKTALNNQTTRLNTQLLVDDDVTNNNNTNSALANIPTIINQLDVWLGYPDFNPIVAGTCVIFDSTNINLLPDTKLKPDVLDQLKADLLARQGVASARVGQLNVVLGSVGQNLSTGVINNSGSGLYDRRFRLLNLRLNTITGSLVQLIGLDQSIAVQEDIKSSNIVAQDTYSSVLFATGFKSGSVGTEVIHVFDASGILIGDSVFVATDDHGEIGCLVVNKIGNTLFFDKKIPQKFTKVNGGRVYKELI